MPAPTATRERTARSLSMLVYLIPVLMVEFVTRFHQASSVTAHQGGVDQHVLLILMSVPRTPVLKEGPALMVSMHSSVFVHNSGLEQLASLMLMSVRGNPVLMLTLAKISLVDITVTAFQDGQE